MTTTELLISHGFSYAGQKFCCGGQKNDIFDDKGAEIHVRTKAKIFRVVQEKLGGNPRGMIYQDWKQSSMKLNLFSKRPKFDPKLKIEKAFSSAGVDYYKFEDAFELPAGSGMAALAIYEELRMRCSREYLDIHIRAMDKIISNNKEINIGLIAELNNNLRERLNLAPFPEHVYKLASVTYFDDKEDVYSYDYAYNAKKVERWKRENILGF